MRQRNPHERRTGADFVGIATDLSYAEQDARRVWRRVLDKVKGARHTNESAYAEYATLAQLRDVVTGEKSQFRSMSDTDWSLLLDTARILTHGLK